MSEALNRQYHELLGWRWMKGPHPYLAEKIGTGDYWEQPSGIGSNVLPPLHASADLCIAELYRVFQDWYVRVEHIDDPACEFHGKKTILVTGENFNREKDDWEPSCSGHSIGNFCEAALKCLIAAHKRESEAV